MNKRDRWHGLVAVLLCAVVAPAQADLVAQWTFNEESGDALDSVTNSPADGSLSNGPVRISDGGRRYMRFSQPLQQYVNMSDPAKLRLPPTNMTILTWWRATNATIFGGEPGVGKLYRYGLTWYSGGPQWWGYAGGSGNGIGGGAPASTLWQHAAVTYDTNTVRVYREASQIASRDVGPDAIPDTTGIPFWVGANYDHQALANSYFTGDIDEVRVYDHLLSQNEIDIQLNNGAPPTPTGLLGAWTFNEDFQDSGPFTNHLTAFGGVTRVPGKVGRAAQFDGSDDYLSVSDPLFTLPRSRFSLGAWFKPTGGSSDAGIIAISPAAIYKGAITLHNGSTVYAYLGHGGQSISAGYGAYADPDGWVHVAHTFDGQNHRLYLNGNFFQAKDHGIWNTGSGGAVVEIGRHYTYFTGLIDEAFFTTEVLTEAEIQATMDGVGPPAPNGIVILIE